MSGNAQIFLGPIIGGLTHESVNLWARATGLCNIYAWLGEKADLSEQDGYNAARQTGLAILATLQANLGSLDRVKRVIKTLGMVNCTPDFGAHPAVINGFSELMGEVFGADNGIGARSAVGMGSLPGNIPVEVEVIFELE